jgi:hypothetical protein
LRKRLTELSEQKGPNNKMNLQPQAENELPRRTRSKLEAHREAIFALRRKHWSYRQIAQWLDEHGVPVTFPSVQRFCQRAIARRPRSSNAPEVAEDKPVFIPTLQTQTNNERTTLKHRFNLDI